MHTAAPWGTRDRRRRWLARRSRRGYVTMDDVAREAGVSRALVSLVMRDSPKVSPHRRERVLDRGGPARLPPERDRPQPRQPPQPNTVGVLLNDLHNPFFAEIANGIEELRVRHRLPAADHHRRPARAARAGDARGAARVPHRRAHPRLAAARRRRRSPPTSARCRASSIGRRVRDRRIDCVMTDEALGAQLAVEHLVGLGHERIVHIDGGRGAGAAPRRAGYLKAMDDGGPRARARGSSRGDFTEEAGAARRRGAAARATSCRPRCSPPTTSSRSA